MECNIDIDISSDIAWFKLIYYNIKANDNGRKLNFNTAPAAASIVRTYPVRPQRWRQCRRTALHAPCNKNILHAFCRFAGAAPHSGPGPVTDTQLPSLTTPACCNYAVNRRIWKNCLAPAKKSGISLCSDTPEPHTVSNYTTTPLQNGMDETAQPSLTKECRCRRVPAKRAGRFFVFLLQVLQNGTGTPK